MKMQITRKSGSKRFPRSFGPLLRHLTGYMVSSTQRKITSGIRPPNAPLTQDIKGGSSTLRDSGALLASIAGRSDDTTGSVGTNVRHARLVHDGGTVTARRAKSLAVPAGSRTRTLMRRYGATPRASIDRMKADGFQIWTQKSVIMARHGKRGQPFALFFLKRSVRIPARPFLIFTRADQQYIHTRTRLFIRDGGTT